MNRAMTNNYLRECHLAAWRIKTGLTEEDYRELKAIYLARAEKRRPVFNYMWHEHSKINQKIEDVGSNMGAGQKFMPDSPGVRPRSTGGQKKCCQPLWQFLGGGRMMEWAMWAAHGRPLRARLRGDRSIASCCFPARLLASGSCRPTKDQTRRPRAVKPTPAGCLRLPQSGSSSCCSGATCGLSSPCPRARLRDPWSRR